MTKLSLYKTRDALRTQLTALTLKTEKRKPVYFKGQALRGALEMRTASGDLVFFGFLPCYTKVRKARVNSKAQWVENGQHKLIVCYRETVKVYTQGKTGFPVSRVVEDILKFVKTTEEQVTRERVQALPSLASMVANRPQAEKLREGLEDLVEILPTYNGYTFAFMRPLTKKQVGDMIYVAKQLGILPDTAGEFSAKYSGVSSEVLFS